MDKNQMKNKATAVIAMIVVCKEQNFSHNEILMRIKQKDSHIVP